MMRREFKIVFILFFGELVFCQNNFNISISNDSIYESAYLQLGLNKNNFLYLGTKNNRKSGTFKLFDYSGNLINENDSLVDKKFENFYIYKKSLQNIAENRYIFIANTEYLTDHIFELNTEQQKMELKKNLYRGSESEITYSSILRLRNGRFLLVEYDDIGFWPPILNLNTYDSQWNWIKSQQAIDSANHSFTPTYIEELADSSILIVGEYDNRVDPQKRISKQFLKIYDSNGNVKTQQLLDINKDLRSSRGSLLRDHNRNFLISAEAYFKNRDSIYYDNESLIVNIDSNYEKLIWLKKLYNPIPNSSLHLFGAGMFKSSIADEFYVYGNFSASLYGDRVNSYVYKFRDNGDSLWMKTYQVISFDSSTQVTQSFIDGKLTPQHKLLFIGKTKNKKTNMSHPWLLQIDEDGCLIPDCNKVANKDILKNPLAIEVFPTLVENMQVYFKSSAEENHTCLLSLYNENGSLLQQSTFDLNPGLQYVLNLSAEILPGNYILQFKAEGYPVLNEKLTVVRN